VLCYRRFLYLQNRSCGPRHSTLSGRLVGANFKADHLQFKEFRMLRSKNQLTLPLIVMVLLAVSSPAAWPQSVYGRIGGTVTDVSGAAVPNTTMTLTNLATAVKNSMESNSSGEYAFVNVVPGRYKLEAEKNGFKKFLREPIVVEIESGIRVDFALQMGTQSETVEVS